MLRSLENSKCELRNIQIGAKTIPLLIEKLKISCYKQGISLCSLNFRVLLLCLNLSIINNISEVRYHD